jgi:hypothetical protein
MDTPDGAGPYARLAAALRAARRIHKLAAP